MKKTFSLCFCLLAACQILFAATGNIAVYFAPQDKPDQKLIRLLNQAKTEVNIAVYSLTKTDIAQAIVSARQRGVKVRILTDREQAANKYARDEYFESYQIPVARDTHKGYMHHKFAVIDGKIVVTGSYNWSNNASYNNDENMLVIESPELAEIFNNEFGRLWQQNK
ncbi:MAG: phospholipase D family protein [Candidatus Margulisbacteria bacterium]|jgi:phosphatidylserine/phosphatidylglycerophosphate/cardiolipin synthase-like enzyme|nr:phospholipase D family protein [Candidatus Margulisiibacteriota bacterium]